MFLIKTRYLIGFRPYRNLYQPYRLRWPIYSEWKTEARAETIEGAKEIRNEFILSEIREGRKDDREWAIFVGRKKVSILQFGKRGKFRVKFSK